MNCKCGLYSLVSAVLMLNIHRIQKALSGWIVRANNQLYCWCKIASPFVLIVNCLPLYSAFLAPLPGTRNGEEPWPILRPLRNSRAKQNKYILKLTCFFGVSLRDQQLDAVTLKSRLAHTHYTRCQHGCSTEVREGARGGHGCWRALPPNSEPLFMNRDKIERPLRCRCAATSDTSAFAKLSLTHARHKEAEIRQKQEDCGLRLIFVAGASTSLALN